jgi:hypothetical protein
MPSAEKEHPKALRGRTKKEEGRKRTRKLKAGRRGIGLHAAMANGFRLEA